MSTKSMDSDDDKALSHKCVYFNRTEIVTPLHLFLAHHVLRRKYE